MTKYTFELNVSPEKFAEVEKIYKEYFGKSVADVIDVLIEQSYLIGDCPFYPEVKDITPNCEKDVQEAMEMDIDWRDKEAVEKWMKEE